MKKLLLLTYLLMIGCAGNKPDDSSLLLLLLMSAVSPGQEDARLNRWYCRSQGFSADYRVIPVYLAASDQTESEIEEHTGILRIAMAAIRGFYSDSMGEAFSRKTYDCTDVVVLKSHHTKAEWQYAGWNGYTRKDGTTTSSACSMWYGAVDELAAWGLLTEAGMPSLGTEGIAYHVIVGGAENGSCGANHYLSANESRVLDWQAGTCPSGRFDSTATDCRGPGVIAHELGHVFSLPHCSDRETCTPSINETIMNNWVAYDRGASFSEEDLADLNVDPFMKPAP